MSSEMMYMIPSVKFGVDSYNSFRETSNPHLRDDGRSTDGQHPFVFQLPLPD